MSPIAIASDQHPEDTGLGRGIQKSPLPRPPLVSSGSLNSFEKFDHTNVIGTEFPDLQLSQILDDDAKIRDLAILGMCSS